MLRVSMLGPFGMTCDGRRVKLQLMQITIILALLSAHGPVERDNLIRKVWPSHAVADKWPTLRRHLSRINSALEEADGNIAMLITEPAGPARTFQIREDVCTDAQEFQHLCADGAMALRDGRCDEASTLLRKALKLWGPVSETGPAPLRCVAGYGFADSYIAELRNQYKTATLGAMKAAISTGWHEQSIPGLRKLDLWYPGQTGIGELLAIALYRSGTMEEAGQVLQSAISTACKAGVGFQRLRGLQEQILNDTFPRRGPLPDEFA